MGDDRGYAPDLVLLVHGTFAHDAEKNDEGPRWWQRDSPTWRALDELLPDGAELLSEGALFHWSGRNAQSHRYGSANELLATLIRLERRGRAYHLVGHSHGGSLIWEALVSAHVIHTSGDVPWELVDRLADGEPPRDRADVEGEGPRVAELARLSGLRSWTTVGTPFLTHRTDRDRPAGPSAPGESGRIGKRWRSRRGVRVPAALALAFVGLALYALVGVSDEVSARPVFVSGHGLALGLVAVAALPIAGGCALAAMYRRTLSRSLAVRERAAETVFARRGGTWLGLWAEQDEAIAGLRRALEMQEKAERHVAAARAKRKSQRRKAGRHAEASNSAKSLELSAPVALVELAPEVSVRGLRVFLRPCLSLANRFVAPRWTAALLGWAAGKALGQDVPYTRAVSVNRWPLPGEPDRQGLPDAVQKRLEDRSNERIAALAPVLRQLLAPTALADNVNPDPLVGATRQDLASASEALLHTSYFEDHEVRALIAAHVRHHASPPPRSDAPPLLDDPTLDGWLRAAYTHARTAVSLPSQRGPERSTLP
ncbi:hypothetical protein [Embleya scabrispora]|uniref:hypothetical protein n=1 Tax=Embleya scabrispora TaxID=159449 RepID=UPI000380D438|nr:hypothetical protein [Embleya scabrispora]MYS80046.1 hypothetical protein [Streptomyces sp. SID5474]